MNDQNIKMLSLSPRKTIRQNPFSEIYKKLNTGETHSQSEMPLLIDIELTNACNFNCLFCYTGTKAHKRQTGFMSDEMYENILDQITPHKIALRFIRWGEPTLHKNWLKYFKMAKERGILCHFNTNGSLLEKDTIEKLLEMHIDSIKFSFQGTDEKTYSEMRYGQDYNKLIKVIELFSKMRGELDYPYLHAATTITYETPEMVEKFKDELGEYCDLVTVGHTNLSHISSDIIKLPQEAKVLLDKAKKEESIEKEYRRCNEVYEKLSINWDGTVSACCGDYDNFMIVGGLKNETIQDIWRKSEKLKSYRKMLSEFRHNELPLCKNCYDTMNLKAKI